MEVIVDEASCLHMHISLLKTFGVLRTTSRQSVISLAVFSSMKSHASARLKDL